MKAFQIPCIKGNATLFAGPLGPQILTNKRTRKDSLSWSLGDENTVYLKGLYRGRYGDAKCTISELLRALHAIGATEEANRLNRATL